MALRKQVYLDFRQHAGQPTSLQQKVGKINVQDASHSLHRAQGRISAAPLDPADISAVQAGSERHLFLAQSRLLAEMTKRCTDIGG